MFDFIHISNCVSGYLSVAACDLMSFHKTETKSSKRWPDIQLHFLSFSPPADGSGVKNFNIKPEVICH